MSIDDNKALARRFIQVWMPGKLGLVDELATSDITVTYPVPGGPLRGGEAFKQVLAHLDEALPDLELSVQEEIAQEDKVAIRWRAIATYQGELLGIPPTGKSLTWTGITIYRFTGCGGARRGGRTRRDAAAGRNPCASAGCCARVRDLSVVSTPYLPARRPLLRVGSAIHEEPAQARAFSVAGVCRSCCACWVHEARVPPTRAALGCSVS